MDILGIKSSIETFVTMILEYGKIKSCIILNVPMGSGKTCWVKGVERFDPSYSDSFSGLFTLNSSISKMLFFIRVVRHAVGRSIVSLAIDD